MMSSLYSRFQCECPDEFTGELCDIDVDECLSNICLNEAMCVNVYGGYQCQCQAGYEGILLMHRIYDRFSHRNL